MKQGISHLWNNAVSKFQLRAAESFYPLVFLSDDFRVPDSEQYMELYQGIEGAKADYPTLIDFAVYTLLSFKENTFAPVDFVTFAATARLKDMSPEEFWQQLSQKIGGLKSQPPFLVDGQIVQAYQLFDEWNFSASAAETASNYYAFYWETTA